MSTIFRTFSHNSSHEVPTLQPHPKFPRLYKADCNSDYPLASIRPGQVLKPSILAIKLANITTEDKFYYIQYKLNPPKENTKKNSAILHRHTLIKNGACVLKISEVSITLLKVKKKEIKRSKSHKGNRTILSRGSSSKVYNEEHVENIHFEFLNGSTTSLVGRSLSTTHREGLKRIEHFNEEKSSVIYEIPVHLIHSMLPVTHQGLVKIILYSDEAFEEKETKVEHNSDLSQGLRTLQITTDTFFVDELYREITTALERYAKLIEACVRSIQSNLLFEPSELDNLEVWYRKLVDIYGITRRESQESIDSIAMLIDCLQKRVDNGCAAAEELEDEILFWKEHLKCCKFTFEEGADKGEVVERVLI
eukprot:snap_masked-scaffold_42-processed-gene-2.8-mRNA-1 protein AED:0.10 eAED:1.00 QI:0/-1/0/1/-1/1/1/0/363